ncbi:hematopoietic cell signal transducer [Esox lucius]|nr:hematopoietic cell signal transducer [Esox lucius]XP_034144968.1 hematopoietic cell signal transducer [Esox lucius]
MAENASLLMVLFLCLCENVVTATDTDNLSCYRIKPGTMASVIIADVILTIGIVIVTYHCASRRRLRKERADKVYMNVRANCKT